MLAALLLTTLCQDTDPTPLTWDDFPVFVWRQRYREKPLPPELVAPFGGTNVEHDQEADWVRERGVVFYAGHAPGRDDLHLDIDEKWEARFKEWYDTRDEALLVREPCLTDPETVQRLEETLARNLSVERPWDLALGISLGDEVGLTPYGNPFDLCRSPTCEERWREYADEHGWPARSPTTDEVRLALGEDDFSLVGPWLARRRFHQDVVLELLEHLAARARELRPGIPIGLLGMVGQTAFGGVDVRRSAGFLDLLECYPVVDARQQLYSLEDRPLSVATIFVKQETPDGLAWAAWEQWLRGADGLVIWSDAALEDSPEHRKRLAEAVADIRAAQRRFPELQRPAPAGVAIVHDANSLAASWLRDARRDGPSWPNRRAGYQAQHGLRERRVREWLRAFENRGFLPGAIDLRDIGGAVSERFPVLILPSLEVLTQDDLDRLLDHVEGGGFLVIDSFFCGLDPWGKSGPDWSALQEYSGERVFAEVSVDRLLERAGLEIPKRFTMSGQASKTRWLTGTADEHVFLLPNLPSPDLRAERLQAIPLEITPGEGWSLTWVHPAPEAGEQPVLPAGDAAVFRLERVEDD